MIAIIDYGMGNIHSVQKALQFYGARTLVTSSPEDLKTCEKIILPGVGAFDDAVSELRRKGLVEAIKDAVSKGKVFLGICLGMQILFDRSEEAKKEKGFSLISGEVKLFERKRKVKIPHMGWNRIQLVQKECPLFKDIEEAQYVYFCHSYYPKPADPRVTAAVCDYSGEFSAVVWYKNIYGVQFHPEKSQAVGLKMIRNFVELAC